jgi:predicted DNA-binding antitoxin AbrB/MazE fold protein
MLDLITAIYENGVLRPIMPLALPEHSRVQIQIQAPPAVDSPAEHRRRVHEVLVAAGLNLPRPPVPPDVKPLSAERREELAQRFATDQPMADLIREEREEADDRLLRR